MQHSRSARISRLADGLHQGHFTQEGRFDVLRHFEYDELIGWRSNQAGFFWYISHVLPEEGGSFDEQWSVATDEGATIAAIVDAATTQEASKRESMRESAREAEEDEEEGEAPPDLEGMTEKI